MGRMAQQQAEKLMDEKLLAKVPQQARDAAKRELLQKVSAEAKRILTEAQAKADEILADAERQAKGILEQAQKDADERQDEGDSSPQRWWMSRKSVS